MKSQFNLELREMKYWMEMQTDNDEGEFLKLSAACLSHAVNMKSNVDQNLLSFGWFAAALCVPQLFQQLEGEWYE